ncbi:predicted protein [Streptomyces sp. C]|nr:predicted protein [Streptomyces sp. C]
MCGQVVYVAGGEAEDVDGVGLGRPLARYPTGSERGARKPARKPDPPRERSDLGSPRPGRRLRRPRHRRGTPQRHRRPPATPVHRRPRTRPAPVLGHRAAHRGVVAYIEV